MNISKRRLVTLGILALLVTLVVSFPARIAYQMASVPGVAMSGISGSAWNGSAREASVNGAYLRNLAWDFQPLRLLSGELSYRIAAEPANGFIDADVGLGTGGRISLRELKGSVPASLIGSAIQFPGMRGTVNLDFERLEIQGGLPTAANGTVRVANLAIPMIHPDSLGGYMAEVATQTDGIVASVEDTDGVFDLAATLRIDPDRTYEFSGLVIAKPSAPDALRQQLRFLGPANDRGQHAIGFDGRL